MAQQINLYQPIFLEQKKQFSARAILQAVAVVLIGIAAVYAYMQWQVGSLREALADAEARHSRAVRHLDRLSRQMARVEDQDLVAEIERLEAELAAREALLRVLQSGMFGNLMGFSEYFTALARQHVTGLWLTGFEIQGAGEAMVLEGRSLAPELVPRYLHRLSDEPTMAGVAFDIFELRRPQVEDGDGGKRSAGYVEFIARTATPQRELP